MFGGENGESGANYWVQKTEDGGERWISIGSRGQVDMKAGDRCVIHTPGGGGWGLPDELDEEGADDLLAALKSNGVDSPKPVYPRATGSFHSHLATEESSF
jgi:5-oxoprolinase (ATP-hydrolysing)